MNFSRSIVDRSAVGGGGGVILPDFRDEPFPFPFKRGMTNWVFIEPREGERME